MIAEAPFLFSVAALSVSLAGFAGLIAAFRRGAEWRPIDIFRLREIVEFGFVNAVLALLMVPLVATTRDISRSVSIVCGLTALYLVVTTLLLVRRQRGLDLPTSLAWYLPAGTTGAITLTVALIGAGSGEIVWLLWLFLFMLWRPMLAFVFVLALVRNEAR
jgi:hypothetical protein